MPEELPVLTYRDELVFHGVLRRNGQEFPVESLVVMHWRHRHPSEILFSFQYRREERDRVMWFVSPGDMIDFYGTWEYRGSAQKVQHPHTYLRLRATLEGGGRVSGHVLEMELDIAELPATPTHQAITAWFTPTPVAFPEHETRIHYRTGETWPINEVRDPFRVTIAHGQFNLVLGTVNEKALVEGVTADVSIPSVLMYAELRDEQRTERLSDLLRGVSETLAGLENVLSFLSRRHVRCYRVTATSTGFGDEPSFREAERYMQGHSTPEPPTKLVDPSQMEPDAVDGVLTGFNESPYREPIQHTLTYLIAYWNSRYAEDRISAAFTALETLVNGISEVRGDTHILDNELFGELRAVLRETIKEFAKEKGLDKVTRGRLYEKIGELQRPALVSRVVALIEEHGIEWQDLWEPRFGVAEPVLGTELREAYGRRSVLVHAGKVEDYGALLANAASVHALTERLVYRLLGGRPEWLDYFAYYYARPRPY